jgi:hypothetical protein
MATTVTRDDEATAFSQRLTSGRLDIDDLLTRWEQMPMEQKRVVVGEIHFRSEELKNLSRELAWRISDRLSFGECLFLGLLVAMPILFKLLVWTENDKAAIQMPQRGMDPGFEF